MNQIHIHFLAYASGDYSGGGGYPAQYSMPPPSLSAGDNSYTPSQQQGGFNQSGYSGQTSGTAWNQQSSGSKKISLSVCVIF